MSAYDLRADIKAILNETSLTDPGEIADKVAESVPARALRTALRVTLRAYVRQVMAEARTHAAPNFSGAGQSCDGAQDAAARPGRSLKVAGIRDGWQRQLSARVHVGESHWKMLADCTYDDLQAAASEREANARRNQSWAAYYHGLAALLTEHDVATVRDLPAEVLMPALGGAA